MFIINEKPIRTAYFGKPEHLLTRYAYCRESQFKPGWIRTPCYTTVIDLTKSIEEIFGGFNATTKNLIHKAEKMGIETEVGDVRIFCLYYGIFAQSRGLPQIYPEMFKGNDTLVLKVKSMPVAHLYLLNGKTALLFRSFNLSRDNKYANRYLHYQDIRYFKHIGYEIYDFGGWDITGEKISINKFKSSFGGNITKYTSYKSIILVLLQRLNNIIK